MQLKVRVGTHDSDVIRSLVHKLGEKTETNPSDANIARALWSLFMQLEDELDSLPRTNLHKPGYGDKEGTAIYEDELAKIILKCFRRSRAFGPERSGPNVRDQTR